MPEPDRGTDAEAATDPTSHCCALGVASALESSFDRLARLAARAIGAPVSISVHESARSLVKGCSVAEGSVSWCRDHCPVILPSAPGPDGCGPDAPPSEFRLCSPMRGRSGDVLGMLHATAPPGRLWTDDHRQTLADFARLAVTELELRAEHALAARSEAELRSRTNMLELRGEVGSLLTRSGPLEKTLQGCAEVLQRRLDVAFFRIWTLDREADVLILRASAGRYTHLDGPHARIPVGRFKIGRIAERRRPHLSNSLADDPLISDPEWVRREGMVAFAGYPLVIDDRLVGVMATFARRALSPLALRSMASIADDLAQYLERKQAEAGRRTTEARKAAILESALDCIITIDHQGSVLEFNPAAERTFGYRRDEALGRTLAELIVPPSFRDAHRDGLSRYLRTGQSRVLGHRIEIEAMRADGSTFPVELAISEVRQEEDAPVFTAYLRDITERKRFEREVNESNAMLEAIRRIQSRYIASDWQTSDVFARTLRAILESTGSAYGFIGEVRRDDDGRPFLKTHAITDISWDEASRRFFAENAPDGLEFRNLETLFGRVIAGGRPVIANAPASDPRRGGLPPGHPPLDAFLGLPVHQGDELVGMIGVANRPGGYDEAMVAQLQPLISTYAGLIDAYRIDQRRRKAESSLRLTQFVIDRAGDSVFWLDPTGAFLYVNDQGCRSLGYSREELLGMTVFDIHTPSDSEALRASWAEHWEEIRRRGSFTFQATHRRKDGGTFPVELTVNFIAGEGREINCTFARDVTAREQAAEQLRQARDAAQAASRSKSEFLANMSHEVRTPMAAVLGFGDMLLDPNLSPADRDRALQGIRSNGAHLLQIIDDILDLSKIEAGKFELAPVPSDPRQVVHEVHSLLRGRAAEKEIGLEISIEEPIPSRIMTDPVRLRQVLVNFLSNAIKFSPAGERVGVRLFVDRPPDGPPILCYEVTDRGIGMDRDQLSRLFRPFVQVDSTATRKHGGTGLGLSISRHLAEALGGRIDVTSEPGRGSRFAVRIPIDLVEPTPDLDPPEPAPEGDSSFLEPALSPMRGSVLVAEDSPAIQLILRYHLSSFGLDAEIVENGLRAVERARSGAFDLILMDMQMPELDGYGATSSLRRDGYDGPIIALTAHALREDRDRCLRAGCTDYLTKPIHVRTLAELLSRYLPRPVEAPPPPEADQPSDARDPAFEGLVAAYLASLGDLLRQFVEAREADELDAIRGISHRTRGVAAMYGFPDLGESAALLEDAIVERQDPELLAELADEFERAVLDALSDPRAPLPSDR